MPGTKLICPTCAAKIQIARELPQGSKGKCPRCQTVFVVPEPEQEGGPQLVDDEEEQVDQPRRRRKRQPASAGGLMSYLALLIAGALVLAVIGVLCWALWYYAIRDSRPADYIPTLPGQAPASPSGASSAPAQ